MVFGFGGPNIKKMEKEKDIIGLIDIALSPLEKDGVRKKSFEALVRMGKPVVEPLIDKFDYENRVVGLNFITINNVAYVFAEIGDPRAVDTLIKLLKEPMPLETNNIIEALVRIGEPAVQPLKTRQDDPDASLDEKKKINEILNRIP